MHLHLALPWEQITWCSHDMAMFWTKWPPCAPGNVGATLLYAVRWCFALSGNIISSNSVDFRVECFIMTPFGCRVISTSRAVMCVSTETWKNVTNHRGQYQNKQFGFERTGPTCIGTEDHDSLTLRIDYSFPFLALNPKHCTDSIVIQFHKQSSKRD